MKSALLIAALSLISTGVFAQKAGARPAASGGKKPAAHSAASTVGKFDGIGKFKVGKSTLAIISELETELGVKVKKALTEDDVYQVTGHKDAILELIPDTVSVVDGPTFASQCKHARVFLIPRYVITEDVELNNLRLTFADGVLAQIRCADPMDLADALRVKYGHGRIVTKDRPIHCTLELTGQKVTHTESNLTESWGSLTTLADYVIQIFYNSECQKQAISFFYISNVPMMTKLYNCETLVTAKREAAALAAKKKKLSGL